MPPDDASSDRALRAMVHRIDPTWTVAEATRIESGYSDVHRLRMRGDDPARHVYLKASTVRDDPGVGTDARICRYLDRRTDLPVPAVLGVVDDHDELPAPYYLMSAMDGEEVPLDGIVRLDDATLRATASDVGRFLGELHGLDGPDGFGHVRYDPERSYDGGRPAGTPEELTLRRSFDSWPAFLESWCAHELDRLRDSRFGELEPVLDRWVERRLGRVSDPHGPVLGRNDHGFHNVLVDRSTGSVTAVLDWAYTLSVSPAFDVAYAVDLFAGTFLIGLPDVEDRRSLVHEAMVDGYASANPDQVGVVRDPPVLYRLLPVLRAMNDFDPWADRFPGDDRPRLAEGLRAEARRLTTEIS